MLQTANSLGIRGGGQGLRFAIVGPSYDKPSDTAVKLIGKLEELPAFRSARTDYDTTQPQLSVRIDREAATKLGVPIATITSLINTMIDYQKAADLFSATTSSKSRSKPVAARSTIHPTSTTSL